MDYYKESLKLHKKHKGKIMVQSKVPVKNMEDFSLAYTPGVAEACREIAKDELDKHLTSKEEMVNNSCIEKSGKVLEKIKHTII